MERIRKISDCAHAEVVHSFERGYSNHWMVDLKHRPAPAGFVTVDEITALGGFGDRYTVPADTLVESWSVRWGAATR